MKRQVTSGEKPMREQVAESMPSDTPTSPLDGAATDNVEEQDPRHAEIADMVASMNDEEISYLQQCLDKRQRGDTSEMADDATVDMERLENEEYSNKRPAAKNVS